MSLEGQPVCEQDLINNTSPTGPTEFSLRLQSSLTNGPYNISIDGAVTATTADNVDRSGSLKRTPGVLAPRWALTTSSGDNPSSDDDSAVVLSVFPAPGEIAPSFRTLPHMVLRDAHMPWARCVISTGKENADPHNVTPWLALIVFSADELGLEDEVGSSYFADADAKVNETMGWDVDVEAIANIQDKRLANFIPKPADLDVSGHTSTSVITVPSTLFLKLFTPPDEVSEFFDVSAFRCMSHERKVSRQDKINPREGETATFSVIVSHRLGPTRVDSPIPVFAHLVSLEGIDGTNVSELADKSHVLMTSLFSWTYTALPPDSPDAVSTLKETELTILRTDLTGDHQYLPVYTSISVETREGEMIRKRLKDGYVMVRHKTQTGEMTAALFRGALSPTRVQYPLHKDAALSSNFGSDLRILDADLGLIDISYESAWNLGKTLAMANPSFVRALSRLRNNIHGQAVEGERNEALKQRQAYQVMKTHDDLLVESDLKSRSSHVSRPEIIRDMKDIIAGLNNINSRDDTTYIPVSPNRWDRGVPSFQTHNKDANIIPQSERSYTEIPLLVADSGNRLDSGIYGTDYTTVRDWVSDRLHLAGIPAQYLISDPSHLPPETIRFFHIDANWTDALIDGALSLANHTIGPSSQDDTRNYIKRALAESFKTPTDGGSCQRIPKYGFLLRSNLLLRYPDLAVIAEFADLHTEEDGAVTRPKKTALVQRLLAEDTLLVLFDSEPPALTNISLTLPAHSQPFVAASSFHDVEDTVELEIKHNCKGPCQNSPNRKTHPRSELFDWDSRTLKIEAYANLVHDNLVKCTENSSDGYKASGPTAAALALQLNDTIGTLVITT